MASNQPLQSLRGVRVQNERPFDVRAYRGTTEGDYRVQQLEKNQTGDPKFENVRRISLKMLWTGDTVGALDNFGKLLYYPALIIDSEFKFKVAMEVFYVICEEAVGPPLSTLLLKVKNQPDDLNTLYDLGCKLQDLEQPLIGAMVLARGFAATGFQQSRFLEELVNCLVHVDDYGEAITVIKGARCLHLFMPNFLLAMCYLYNFQVQESRDMMDELRVMAQGEKNYEYLCDSLDHMNRRYDSIKQEYNTRHLLTPRDVRGWMYVINGIMLLHKSPYHAATMKGRYGFWQDTNARCFEGIKRAKNFCDKTGVVIKKVYYLPDRNSEILGIATGLVLGLPFERWPKYGTHEPACLIVCYDLDDADLRSLRQLQVHKRGQVFWAHAMSWLSTPLFAPDLVTLLYTSLNSPWDAREEWDADRREMVERPPPRGAPRYLAEHLSKLRVVHDFVDDFEEVDLLATIFLKLRGTDSEAELFKAGGVRGKVRRGSPVITDLGDEVA